jgi:hypothetical protein
LYPSNTYKFDIRRLTPNSYYNKKYWKLIIYFFIKFYIFFL